MLFAWIATELDCCFPGVRSHLRLKSIKFFTSLDGNMMLEYSAQMLLQSKHVESDWVFEIWVSFFGCIYAFAHIDLLKRRLFQSYEHEQVVVSPSCSFTSPWSLIPSGALVMLIYGFGEMFETVFSSKWNKLWSVEITGLAQEKWIWTQSLRTTCSCLTLVSSVIKKSKGSLFLFLQASQRTR